MLNYIYGNVIRITDSGKKATCELLVGPLKVFVDIPIKEFPTNPYFGMPISVEVIEEKNKTEIKMREINENTYLVRSAKIKRIIANLDKEL